MTTITKQLAEALRDAARSLETIGRLAGKPYYGRDEQGEPIPTYMGHNDEVRSYANNRAGVARAALASQPAVPDGYVLVPEKATPLIREALRIGMRREVPNDDLCDIRWRAAIAAAAPGEQKGGV